MVDETEDGALVGFRVILAGEDLGEYRPRRLSLQNAFALKAVSGLTPVEVLTGLFNEDPASMQAVIWFLSTHAFDVANNCYVSKGVNVDASTLNFYLEDLDVERVTKSAPKSPPPPPAPSTPVETSQTEEPATSSS